MAKKIQIKSKDQIIIKNEDFVKSVNALRLRSGDDDNKFPIDFDYLSSHSRVLQDRDEDFGMFYFELCYKDENGTSCVRDFPNFGLKISSASEINFGDAETIISVQISIEAGKAKWQTKELEECSRIINAKAFSMRLNFVQSQNYDWAGYASQLITNLDEQNELGLYSIAYGNFEYEIT